MQCKQIRVDLRDCWEAFAILSVALIVKRKKSGQYPVFEIMASVVIVRARGWGREELLEQGLRADRGKSQRIAPEGATSYLCAATTIDATSGTPVADSAETCTILGT